MKDDDLPVQIVHREAGLGPFSQSGFLLICNGNQRPDLVVHDLPRRHVHNAMTQMFLQTMPHTFQVDGTNDDDLPVQIVLRKA